MRNKTHFKEGDKVFAKIKGYAAWPAMIVGKSGKKFSVRFYGTGEMGFIKPEELFYYIKNKTTLARGSKKREFLEGITQIETDIAAAGGTDGSEPTPNVEDVSSSTKRKRSISDKSIDSQASKKGRKKAPEFIHNENTLSSEAPESNKSEESGNEEEAKIEDLIQVENIDHKKNEDDVKLVSEQSLRNWVTYAQYVNENPDYYKEKSADVREYSRLQVLPLESIMGSYVALKLHKSWPISFTNEYDNAMYDSEVATRLLGMKDEVCGGLITPETDPNLFMADFKMAETDIQRDFEAKRIYNKYKRVGRLRKEFTMVDLDIKIKNCLGLKKADPNAALVHLEALIATDFDELMLKKHAHIPEMIGRLRRYIGNSEEWNLSDQEAEVFMDGAQSIREKANEAYSKIRSVVKLPLGTTNFWEGFNEIVNKFKEHCKGLTNKEVFTLCAEPQSREAILDRLQQNEVLDEIERPLSLDDEENSSDVANSENKAADDAE